MCNAPVYCQGGDATCVWWGVLLLTGSLAEVLAVLEGRSPGRIDFLEMLSARESALWPGSKIQVSRVTDESSQNVVCLGQHFSKPAATNRHTGVNHCERIATATTFRCFLSSTFNFITNYDI